VPAGRGVPADADRHDRSWRTALGPGGTGGRAASVCRSPRPCVENGSRSREVSRQGVGRRGEGVAGRAVATRCRWAGDGHAHLTSRATSTTSPAAAAPTSTDDLRADMTVPLVDPGPRRGRRRRPSATRCDRLAQLAERSVGYRRVWYAEHHNMPRIASAATSVLIAHVAAHTSTIRLGAGGVMLPNHSPLVIAEQFGTLAELHPGRIELGLGRAPAPTSARSRRCAATPAPRSTSRPTSSSSRATSRARRGSRGSTRRPGRAPTSRSTSSARRCSARSSPRSSGCPTRSRPTSHPRPSSRRSRSTASASNPRCSSTPRTSSSAST
jgi:hypothetical protein